MYATQVVKLAVKMPFNKLFLFREHYEWRAELELVVQAYWLTDAVGDAFTEGLAAARQQVQQQPERALFRDDLKFFEKLAARMDGAVGE